MLDPISAHLGLKTGFLLHNGYQLKCSSPPDADGNSTNHLIATLVMTAEALEAGVEVVAVGNSTHDGQFVLDPAQTSFDPLNPKCCICSSGVQL